MIHTPKFKDEHIVIFNGETFDFNGKKYEVYGTTGIDIDVNTVQVRDDLWIGTVGTRNPMSFNYLVSEWDRIEPLLIKIVKRKTIISTKAAA